MASNCNPSLMRERSIVAVLKSAACEWVVILVMLFNAVVSYLINKFASYSDVQIPCIFCSRIDHALGDKKPGFTSKLFCQKHKAEVSSMVLCAIHDKVANGSGMCEECLLSNVEKHDSTIFRALLSKGGNTTESYHRRNFLRNTDIALSSVGTRLCSCCKKPWILRNRNDRTRRFKFSKPNVPLPHIRNKNNDNWKQHRLLSCSMTDVEYSGLRFTSDSESEFPFSDEDEPIVENSTSPIIDSSSMAQLISFDLEVSPKDDNSLIESHPIQYEDPVQNISASEHYSIAVAFSGRSTNNTVEVKELHSPIASEKGGEEDGLRELIRQLREDLEKEKERKKLLNGELEEEKNRTSVLNGVVDEEKNRTRVLNRELEDERKRSMNTNGELEEERKRTSALLGELEEERNASAVAANETMAMITRLQEEKASLHMEALQYLRMMEEQAEYNVDALEKANDLLAEREKEIMEMEADIEAYQSNLSQHQPDTAQAEFTDAKMIISDALKEMEMKVKKLTDNLSSINEDTHDGSDGGESMDHLRKEASNLRVRFEGFESDWKFINHAVKSLDYGEEGLRFVEEIARSLNELRKMGL